jgi:hypothetical protein
MNELQQLRDAVAEHRYALRNHRFALQLIRERIVSFEA